MRNVVLRLIRRILRRLDVTLDPTIGVGVGQPAPPTNGNEAAIEAFLSSIDIPEPNASAYLFEHKERLIRTLSLLPPGNPRSVALELGSYLHMAAAMERVLGYEAVRSAYYSPSIGRETKSLPIKGRQPFTTEIDLFDAESHVFPYSDSTFDLVLCCELVEHLLHDPMHMLLECRRVLADDGLLVVTTPNAASLTSVWAALEGRHNPQVFSRYPTQGNTDTPHVREYTPHEIAQALRSAGFQVDLLVAERKRGTHHATWVLDILKANDFDTSLRGEQIYCLARKRSSLPVDRFPQFLYSPQS